MVNALFEIKTPDGTVIVEEGRRITARHVRYWKQQSHQNCVYQRDLYARALAKDLIDTQRAKYWSPC